MRTPDSTSGVGQRYAPEDIGSVLSYREATDGQILEEGISQHQNRHCVGIFDLQRRGQDPRGGAADQTSRSRLASNSGQHGAVFVIVVTGSGKDHHQIRRDHPGGRQRLFTGPRRRLRAVDIDRRT